MPMPYEVFVASMVFASIITAIIGLVGAFMALTLLNVEIIPTVILSIVSSMGLAIMTFFGMQVVPILNSKNRAAKLSDEIPHYIGYMATLCASG